MHAPEEHHRRLERMYLRAPINAIYTPSIAINDSAADVSVIVVPAFHHAAHALHGSVYFKCLDDAAFFAASSVVTDVFLFTVTFNVVLLRPVSEGVITATGRLVHRTRNLLVAEAELYSADQKVVARGSGTFMRSTIALTPALGYE
ncbi:MAG: PaaI family thioesterase [Gemmatimonadaceae bacterium]